MLVLTRKERDSIMVGDDVEIVVVAISPNRVRLGIRAPNDVVIVRKELQHPVGDQTPPHNPSVTVTEFDELTGEIKRSST